MVRRYKKSFFVLATLICVSIITLQFLTSKAPHVTMETDFTMDLMSFDGEDTGHRYFIKVPEVQSFFISAVARENDEDSSVSSVIVTGLDETGGSGEFTCCVLNSNGSLIKTAAVTEQVHGPLPSLPVLTRWFFQTYYYATQYRCDVPTGIQRNLDNVNISLTSKYHKCSSRIADYLPVKPYKKVRNGLAVCAKVAYGHALKASRLIEWFEMQKILGVDRILIYDLDCGDEIKNVFQHYVEEGLLEVQPYSLPGTLKRSFVERVKPQDSHDEVMTIKDCHERLGGYDYIMAGDFDEIIIPKGHLTLKDLIKELTMEHPDSAGFYFHVQFHIEEWGRYRNDTDIYFQQYLMATKPRWECEKYIYLPSRVSTAIPHYFYRKSPYSQVYVEPDVATIHHYRKCPHTWSDCNPGFIVDKNVQKYEELHTKNTHKVLDKLKMKSYDSLV